MKLLSLSLFILLAFGRRSLAAEVTARPNRIVSTSMTGEIQLQGTWVSTATSGTIINSKANEKGSLELHGKQYIAVTQLNGSITAETAVYSYQGSEVVDNIAIKFEGKTADSDPLSFEIDLQPILFQSGDYPKATRFPFNTEVKYETIVDDDKINSIVRRVSVVNNGFWLTLNSSGLSDGLTDLKIDDVFYNPLSHRLENLTLSFKESGTAQPGYQGKIKLVVTPAKK